ncbi:MAG: PD-(D/E)XK nuclease family protein [Phormidesmis sp.]
MLPLSQAHLTLLSTCDRKYQHVFLNALSGPSTLEQQATTQWGSQFHLLMQQRALNLPVEVLANADTEMVTSIAALEQAAPDVFEHLSAVSKVAERASDQAFCQSEHRRTLAFNGYLLTVVYDLLVCSSEAGQIFDWKTHQHPPRRAWLQADWQTRLYLYVLAETTNLGPEQLSMTYWFVRLGNSLEADAGPASNKREAERAQPTAYCFDYSAAQHQRTQRDLQQLTDRLTRMRQQHNFPKVDMEKGLCDRCPFNVRCDRIPSSAPLPATSYQLLQSASQLTVDQIEEIPL